MTLEEEQTAIASLLNMFDFINKPQCEKLKDYGLCKESEKANFLHELTAAANFFRGSRLITFDFFELE